MAMFDITMGRSALKTSKAKGGEHGEGFPLKFYYIIKNRETQKQLVIHKEMGSKRYEESIIEALRGLGSKYPKVFYYKLKDADDISKTVLRQRRFENSLNNPNYDYAKLFYDDDKQLVVVISKGVDSHE